MADNNSKPPGPGDPAVRGDAGALLLAAGGLAAAFGVASCCALPMLLASLGLGSAWLIAVAWVAAPHRLALLVISAACLAGGGLRLWRRRGAACPPNGLCARPPLSTLLGAGILSLAAILAVLGFAFA